MSGLLQVLVIEDNPDDAQLMARALRQNGFEFDWQRVDTQAGLLRALKRRPDLILSDYNLSGWTGIEAFEALRKAGHDAPFILVTGALGDEAAVECLKRGMADYVLKDNLRRLPLAVRRTLETHQAQLERSRAEEALKSLARGTARVTGEAFFPALVENLARALGVRWALVGRLCGGEQETVETLALWDGDHLADNITYDLAGAPCGDVIRERRLCVHTDGVQARFPQDTLLREMGAVCYMGAPLYAADGSAVGLLAVLDDRPYRAPPGVEETFRVFAARAAVELERLQQMAALEEAAQEWGRTFDTMSDMVTIHDSEFRIVRANRAAARAFGFEPEDMIGQQCYQVFHHLDCPVENCPLHRSLRSGELETLEIWEPTIDKHLLVTTNPIRDAEGRTTGAVHVARDITARKQAEQLQDAVYRIAQAADIARTLEDLYPAVHEIVHSVMPASNFYIALYDEQEDLLSFPFFMDEVDEPSLPSRPGKGLTEYVLRTGKSLLCDAALFEELQRRGEAELVGTPSPIWLGVPLSVEDKIIGVMVVQHYSDPYAYGKREQRMLEFVSSEVARAIDRKRAEEALRESETLHRDLVETSQDLIWKCDAEGRFTFLNQTWELTHGYPIEEMLGRRFTEFQAPEVAERDIQEFGRHLAGSSVSGYETTHISKSGDEIHLLFNAMPLYDAAGRIVGTQGTAHDITARKRTEATLKALNAAAADLQRVGLSEAEIYGTATEQLTALGLQGAITLFDAAADSFTFEYFFLPGGLLATVERLTGVTPAGFLFPRARVPAYDQVVQSGQAVYVADRFAQIVAKLLPESVSRLAGQLAKMIGPASAILAPLRVEDRVMGVLHVGADWVTEADIPAITAFADQLSAALENARLYQAALQAAERRNILHWASQEIVRVAEDPEQVYQAVHQAAAQLMPCEAFVIALADDTRQAVTAVYLVDQGGRWPAQRIPSGHGLSGQVLASGESLLIDDFSPTGSEIDAVQFGDPIHVRSILAVPMRLGERIIGVISAQSYRPYAYTTEDQHLLEMLAAHAAVAVENTRLYEAERRQTAELARSNRFITALGQVAARIGTVPDPDGVMGTLGAELKQLSFDSFVAVLEPDGQSVTLRYVSLGSKALALAEKLMGRPWRGFRMPRERWLHFSDVFEKGRAAYITDTESRMMAFLPGLAQPALKRVTRIAGVTPDTPAILLPLKVEEQLVGVLGVWGEDLREADVPAATIFASQVAGALERAQLFDETRRRAEETAALLTTAQAITSLDLNAVLETIVRQARTLFRADGSRIHLIEPDGETLRCAVALHDRAEDVMAVRLKLGQGFTGRVALSGEPELILNTLADSQHIQVPGTPVEPEAVALTPLKVGQQVVGVMTVTRLDLERPFSESDLTLLTAFANQAAVAIENARLFEQMKRRAQQLTLVSEIASRAVAVLDPDALFWETAEAIQSAFGYPDVLIFLVDHQHQQIIRNAWAGCYKRRETTNDVKPIEECGIIDWVAARGETVLANDVRRDPRYVPLFERTAAELCVPLRDGETIIGGINVESDEMHAFDQSDVLAMEALADTLVVALRNARLYAETRRRAEELGVLADVSTALREAGTVEEMVPVFVEKAVEAVDGVAGTIFLFESGTGDIVARGRYPPEREPLDVRHPPGEGITGHVYATGELHFSEDLASDPLARMQPGEAELLSAVRSAIALPLRTQERTVGVMHVGLGERRAFTDEEVRLLTAIAEMAGNSLHRAALHEQTTRHVQRLTAIRNIDKAISSSLDLKVVLNVLLTQIAGQPGVDAADVLLYHPRTETLEYAAGCGFYTTALQRTRLRLGEGLAGQAALEQQTVSISDFRFQISDLASGRRSEISNLQSAISNLQSEGFTAYYALPLISKGQVKGVLEVYQREPQVPDPQWLEFLEAVTAQAAIAIDNATLLDQLQRSNLELTLAYDVTLEGWSRALELRDAETEGHTRRVTEMVLRLARAMGLNGSTLAHIRRGALLHDIGKLGIPDSVLLKPGELGDEDWDIIRLHPVHAYRLLSPIAYLRPALDIPYCHHERWDGTGYPQGLKGEQIPLPARIFAVVDVYDALRSDRPYRKAWPEEKVRNHILEQAGKHFEPEVVEVFMRLLENGL